ncbi:MAG: histidinol-phosphate transaminase, partial [Peptococcaceae bacterium]|nr:histidinol-phosphate transaminase [Peptococcaceae bacterium]
VRRADGAGSPRCLRVAVGTPEENDAFLAALKEILADKG